MIVRKLDTRHPPRTAVLPARDTQLSHEQNVQRPVQSACNLERNRRSAARQSEHGGHNGRGEKPIICPLRRGFGSVGGCRCRSSNHLPRRAPNASLDSRRRIQLRMVGLTPCRERANFGLRQACKVPIAHSNCIPMCSSAEQNRSIPGERFVGIHRKPIKIAEWRHRPEFRIRK